MFITFEGIEGCGKTTQIKRLVKNLEGYGFPLVTTLEPGGTRIGEDIRRILLNSRNKDITSLSELILYIADRAQHVEEIIGPALDQGKWVICDRFFDATVAYQGYARGLEKDLIRNLNDICTKGIKPDITFLLDCPVDTGLKRAIARNEKSQEMGQDRFEREKLVFHQSVRDAYVKIADEEPERFRVIDAALSEDVVERSIFEYLKPFLNIK